jgi:ATP-dependent RNA helicase DDX56/DBP9
MKRKLDENDVPSPEAPDTKDHPVPDNTEDFESLSLDPRLRQALVKEKFSKPTPVQAKAIPLALEGKDILGSLGVLSSFCLSC